MPLITWTENIPGSLWSRTDPVPAYIIFDGASYNLTIEATSNGLGAAISEASLDAVWADYVAYATNLFAPSVNVVPNLPSLALPNDGEKIVINTPDNGWMIGIYDAADSQLIVAAATVALSDWISWTASL